MRTILELMAAVRWMVVFRHVYEGILHLKFSSVLSIEIKVCGRNAAYNRNINPTTLPMTS